MAIESDVVVIGGGLAGTLAGIAAARRGARVYLLSATESTLRQSSGVIDVLGYPTPKDGPVVDPVAAIDTLPDEHPYRKLGNEAVNAALELFDAVTAEVYDGSPRNQNALLLTPAGTVKPTWRYPATAGAGLLSDPRSMLLIGFETIPDFNAPFVTARLSEQNVPCQVSGATIRIPGDFRADAVRTRIARALDRNEPIAGSDDGMRSALADAIRPHLDDAARVGMPAILGYTAPHQVLADLEAELGVDVFEVPIGPPSIPGMRLEDCLLDMFQQAGGRVHHGAVAADAEARNKHIQHVTVDHHGRDVRYTADAYVLATGGLIGGGLRASRESVEEPLFGCAVPHPVERYAWFDERPFGPHAFARFGVRVDDTLRPLDERDTPAFENLFAAGSVIGGIDFTAEHAGSGVAITTGVHAGIGASEVV